MSYLAQGVGLVVLLVASSMIGLDGARERCIVAVIYSHMSFGYQAFSISCPDPHSGCILPPNRHHKGTQRTGSNSQLEIEIETYRLSRFTYTHHWGCIIAIGSYPEVS